MGKCLCDACSALCCRYFALEIDEPETRRQFDDVRWYLVHENVVVFIEKRKWYLGIMTRCKHLQPDNRCGIYERRPRICRSYSTDNCEYHGGDYDYEKLFTSAAQLEAYADEVLAEKRKRPRRRTRAKRRGKALRARIPSSNGQAVRSDIAFGDGNGRVRMPVVRP